MQNMITKDLHILMLEDEPLDVELNKAQLLLLEEYNCIVDHVMDKYSYLRALEETTPDIILSDYNLPQYDGLIALEDLKKRNLVIPFIFVTGTINEETAASTIKAGAWDYVVKDRLVRLPLAIRSALKLKEEKLLAANAEEKVNRLLTGIEQTSVQIIVANENGIIDYVNQKFTEVTGLTPEEVIGKKSISFSQKNYNPEIIEKLKAGEVYRGEELSRRKDGSDFWELTSITPIKNNSGKITSYVAVKEDITQRKRMEQEITEARDKAERSDKLKDAFLQNLSHEIRTPLNAVVGFSDILNTETDYTEEKIKDYTSIIRENSHQLLSIVTDILTIASIQTGQEHARIKPMNVSKLINRLHDIFLPLANAKNLELLFSYSISNPNMLILADETKIEQILTNLLNNALKFTHSGSIRLNYYIHGKNLIFSVEDTGIGITKEAQTYIFERFRQAEETTHIEYGGTGLGLSISKSFAEMLGGDLQVESEPGKGSTFNLIIPYSPVEEKPSSERIKQIVLLEKELTILIVEDEITNYLLLKTYLKHPFMNLLYAENGYEAVKMCTNNNDIDIVLMDIKMPVMDGVSAFEKIHSIRPDLPVIAQTAYGMETEKYHFLKIGFNGYISKPIKKDDLFETIKQILKQHQ